jgi:hypothetical protein
MHVFDGSAGTRRDALNMSAAICDALVMKNIILSVGDLRIYHPRAGTTSFAIVLEVLAEDQAVIHIQNTCRTRTVDYKVINRWYS